MDIEITPAIAAARHPAEWAALEKRLKGKGVAAHYRPAFVKWWEDTSHKPCADLSKELLHTALNIKALKLVATDAAGTSRGVSLDLQSILTTQPQSLWPIELAGQDLAEREKRRAHWLSVTISRTGRTEREVWQFAGLARRPFRGGFAWVAQLVKEDQTSLLVVDPANSKRLVDHSLVMDSLDQAIYAPKQENSYWLHNRIARNYPCYLFGHQFIDPITDAFRAKDNKQWQWFDAQSTAAANWIALHLTSSPQGFSLTLEDSPRLDVRDYRDDEAGKPRRVI